MRELLCVKCDTWKLKREFRAAAGNGPRARRICHACRPETTFVTRKCTACSHVLSINAFDGDERACRACLERKIARELLRAEWNPGRREHVPGRICSVCCALTHRVIGPRCRECGLLYAPDVIVGDAWKRKPSQWALLMSGGESE